MYSKRLCGHHHMLRSYCDGRKILFACILCFTVALCFAIHFHYITASNGRLSFHSTHPHGQRLLDCLTDGIWRKVKDGNLTVLEKRLDDFYRKTRDSYHLPNPLQREDGMCGNISFGSRGVLRMFRAVCDPFQATPCCFHGRCRNLSEEACTCPECYDLRSKIYGEVSEWIGSNSACSLRNFSSEEACAVLRGRTVVFIGDSFMRQMFMGLQILLSNNDVDSCMKATMRPEMEKHCKWMFMFTRECRLYVPQMDIFCRGTVTIYLYEYYNPGSRDVIQILRKHDHSSSTVFVFGIGFHYNFNAAGVIESVAGRVIKEIKDTRGSVDNIVWVLPHALGVLKTPRLPTQLNPAVLTFNTNMRQYLTSRHVAVMDAYNLTRNLASYDGSHYPKAANLLKVQILVNYLSKYMKLVNIQA